MSGAELAALQQALAAEQQIGYGYGVLGAHLPESEQRLVTGVWQAHLRRRDRLAALIAAAGARPVTPAPAYALPFPVTDAAAARRLAGYLERRGATVARALVAATSPRSAGRRLATGWLVAAAVDEVRVAGRLPPALPGTVSP